MTSTKGPWVVKKQLDRYIILSNDGQYICHVPTEMYSEERVKSGELEANFALMAQAPELLKKLEDLNVLLNTEEYL